MSVFYWNRSIFHALTLGVFASAALGSGIAPAQAVDEFYKGRSIQIVIGYPSGSSYDIHPRTLARHMGRHIPGNPGFVPLNMPGAGSLTAANHLFNVAPRDGTVMGVIGRGMPLEPLFGNESAKFDPRQFNWIGSASDEVSICASWHDSGVSTFDDVREQEVIIGGSSAGADSIVFPNVLNVVFGTKFKIIPGYSGGAEVVLAMERGELQGRCGWSWSAVRTQSADLLEEPKRINILIQLATREHRDLSGVPLVIDVAETEEQRQLLNLIFARQTMAYPVVAPPDIPSDRVAALREAFDATMNDDAFLADAERAKLEINPVGGEEILSLIETIYAAPKEVIESAKEATGL